jgi:hypothetical protein
MKMPGSSLTTVILPFLVPLMSLAADNPPGLPVSQVIQLYVQSLGGRAAVDHITSRQLEIGAHRGSKSTLYWLAPNKVLRVHRQEKEAFDGSIGWAQSKRKRLTRLPHAEEDEMLTDADPIRFVHLGDMYPDLQPGPPETIESTRMDVVVAPNHIGSTKFYFDNSSHMLVRIEEFGVNSAYYKHITVFSEYKELDGVKLPFHIERSSEEPGAEHGELTLSNVKQNVPLNASLFAKPNLAPIMGGGKR